MRALRALALQLQATPTTDMDGLSRQRHFASLQQVQLKLQKLRRRRCNIGLVVQASDDGVGPSSEGRAVPTNKPSAGGSEAAGRQGSSSSSSSSAADDADVEGTSAAGAGTSQGQAGIGSAATYEQPRPPQTYPSSQTSNVQATNSAAHDSVTEASGSGAIAYALLSVTQPEALLPKPFPSTRPFRLYLDAISVSSHHQRRGLARRLVAACERIGEPFAVPCLSKPLASAVSCREPSRLSMVGHLGCWSRVFTARVDGAVFNFDIRCFSVRTCC